MEALVSLALLGVVSSFTISKVLVVQNDARRKAVFKETLASLHEVFHRGVMEGAIVYVDGAPSIASVASYPLSTLNTVKRCATNSVSQGCWTHKLNGAAPVTWPGFSLHNGATGVIATTLYCKAGCDVGASIRMAIDWTALPGLTFTATIKCSSRT